MTCHKKTFVLLPSAMKRRITAALAVFAMILGIAAYVYAHSVGQVQTTKYFTQETVDMLVNRAASGTPGLQVGDTISYIIQFTPIANGSDTGVAGYITDYIPSGVEVVGASIVAKDGSGNFYDISPSLPGGIDTGWGDRGQNTFLAPFDTGAYDSTGRCPTSAPVSATDTYTSSTTWTAPSGATSVTVEAWGGGGAGGGGDSTTGNGGSGGGGGGYSKKNSIAVTSGNNYTVTVGAGGNGGTGNGGAGGDSYFINTSTILAKGGSGGAKTGGAAGTGGLAASGIGDITYSGGNGYTTTTTTGGGGGGSGGSGSAGNNAASSTGASAVIDGGQGGDGSSTGINGNPPASGNGGGGGGGGRRSGGSESGGNGASGKIILTYTYTPLSNNCNARLTELYADTGIFFSTDSRTSQYPSMPTRITQGTNGYNINPTGAANLNTLLNQASATTHNLWDADQTNAFGSTAAAVAALASPKSAQTNLINTGNQGRGPTPYNAGSAVAGPQTGYQLDDTGQVGPWQRISYPGSRMGDNTLGPATAAGACLTCVGGSYTSVGRNLSPSNPLPSGTNAVRWAVGKLVVGTMSYVKVSLRITGIPPSSGIVNSSEVFGGDASDADDGKDNTWRYHVPSVADNNSNLYVLKTVVGYYSGSTLVPGNGSYIPANAKLRYRITYLNSGNSNQDNVILSDTLPCQTAAGSVSNITVISGSISATINPAAPAAGVCPGTRQTFSFNNGVGVTLLPAASGSIEFDVQTNAALGNTVTNTAKLTSTQIPSGVTSNVNSYVQTAPNLTITKTTSTPTVLAGGTASYMITITNNGTAATATTLQVYDILPSDGAAVDATKRFSYLSTASITGLTSVVPTVTGPPPTLTPYNTGGNSANQQQVLWDFGAQSLAVGASATITFNVTVGANVTASATPYYNSAVVTYNTTYRTDTTNTAGVTVTSPLSVTKTIESYYDTATLTWVPYSNNIPANAKVRYNIAYSNTGGVAINNANITDTLPCQIGGAGMVSNINIVSGPIAAPAPNPPTTIATTCPTTQSFSFTAGTLNAGQTGQIKLDVQTNAAAGSTVTNTATLSGTGATSVNSSAQASVTTAPLLTISKTASVAGVAQGGTLSYTITVANTGTANATNIVLYDWLPPSGGAANAATRFSYSSATSITGMTSVAPTTVIPPTKSPYSTDANAANMQEVAWNFGAQTLAPGASFTVVFVASVGASVPVSTAYYNNTRVYYGTEQANAGAVGVAVGSNLSTSTKTWTDINGGDANPSDVIEYTITLKETAGIAVTGASVSDTLPATLTSPTVVTCPAGATCGFAGQALTVTGISVSANGTTTIVFRATIAAGTAAGTTIDNCATITNTGGVGASPCAATLTVAASTVPGFGNKPLYFYDAASAYKLSRTAPTSGATVSIAASTGVQTWTLTPTLASSVTISNTISTTVPVQLYLSAAAAATNSIKVDLYCSATPATLITLTQNAALTTTSTLFTFNLPFTGPVPSITCGAGASWVVKVSNLSAGAVIVSPYASATQISNVSLPSQNVIAVSSITPYSTAYSGTTSPATYAAGSNVYIRAVVSDPFGSYDITSALITIKDSNNTTVVSSAAMTMVNDSGAADKTFEYAYPIPSGGPGGVWNVTVTAKEGTENIVSDTGLSSFYVSVMPSITLVKSVQTYSDPINGTTSPKAIPGSFMTYTILATNSGAGAVDNNTTVITDVIPANTELYVSDIGGAGSGPALFVDGAPVSGLCYDYANPGACAGDSLLFSHDGGTSYVSTFTADANGCDATVTHIKIALGGVFNGIGGGNPSFSLKVRVRVK